MGIRLGLVAKLLVDDSHLNIDPTCPVSVIVPPLPVEQTVAPPLVVPPTDGASSVITTELKLDGQGAGGVIVQVKVYVLPGTNPMAVAFALVASSK